MVRQQLPRLNEQPTRWPAEATPWTRVTLAPGLELQYQPSKDAARDAAIQRIIALAVGELAKAMEADKEQEPAQKRARGKKWFHQSAKKEEQK
jgi:hypothetical protein